ncbi:uncharacterized protein EV420DRAFT_1574034 [Desarmillaria tabescens]|uniref:Secreted protein n=1 Tax=Armillaria tabescens TaxID=1929756 RepID=A0AA39MRQ4_ARMTA|nr:uncharacterized protein EV420DRAFT_1574034 [Desarmillaria tabescens]KAK0444631.1 hypothetical protein EV420DRAFT_1574034 [Desarmillaria tabescens]
MLISFILLFLPFLEGIDPKPSSHLFLWCSHEVGDRHTRRSYDYMHVSIRKDYTPSGVIWMTRYKYSQNRMKRSTGYTRNNIRTKCKMKRRLVLMTVGEEGKPV